MLFEIDFYKNSVLKKNDAEYEVKYTYTPRPYIQLHFYPYFMHTH